ncbi:ZP domain-containing protein-like [Branchiostoma floridae x Branchiostoma japonicum]
MWGLCYLKGHPRLLCKYERHEWVESTFLPIPGGLNFTEEGFGQLEVRLSMFPTRQYQSPYRANQYPIPLRMRQHIYMQLEVQGHGQKLSVLALNCKATMSPQPNDTLQYQLINDGCASDPTLQIYNINDNSKERFGFEAFRFIREVKTVYVHCEVMVCNAFDTGSRCAQGCVRRGKRATGEKADMKGRHMIYQGPIILDEGKEETVRLLSDQETASGRQSAPRAMLAAGGGLMALALVVMGAAIVLKRFRRDEWAYQGLPNMAEDGE